MIDIPNEPLLFDLFYGGKGAGEETDEEVAARMRAAIPEVTEETPSFRNIFISNVNCKGTDGRAMFFNGLPEMPVKNVSVKNVVISQAKKGIVISQAEDVTFENVRIETVDGSDAMKVNNAKNLKVDGKEYAEIGFKAQAIEL